MIREGGYDLDDMHSSQSQSGSAHFRDPRVLLALAHTRIATGVLHPFEDLLLLGLDGFIENQQSVARIRRSSNECSQCPPYCSDEGLLMSTGAIESFEVKWETKESP